MVGSSPTTQAEDPEGKGAKGVCLVLLDPKAVFTGWQGELMLWLKHPRTHFPTIFGHCLKRSSMVDERGRGERFSSSNTYIQVAHLFHLNMVYESCLTYTHIL